MPDLVETRHCLVSTLRTFDSIFVRNLRTLISLNLTSPAINAKMFRAAASFVISDCEFHSL